jgi:hypothetical protein
MDKVETRKIEIVNKSNNVVYCLKAKSDFISESCRGFSETYLSEFSKISKDTIYYVYNKNIDWDSFINVECKNGKLRLFIISKDSIDKYGWSEVLTKNIYSKVYKLNMDDLEKCNWKITYYWK